MECPQFRRWECTCHYVWNTFDSGGQCPGCGNIWYDTICLACDLWSPHAEWYHDHLTVHDSIEESIENVIETKISKRLEAQQQQL